LKKGTGDMVGAFQRSRSDSAPGNCALLPPRCAPDHTLIMVILS